MNYRNMNLNIHQHTLLSNQLLFIRYISQLKHFKTRSGHFSDRTFFENPVMARILNLLSVINIDSLFVCLPVTLLSFILLLCSRELPLRRAAKCPKRKKPDNYRTVAVLRGIEAVSRKKHRSAYRQINQCSLPFPHLPQRFIQKTRLYILYLYRFGMHGAFPCHISEFAR